MTDPQIVVASAVVVPELHESPVLASKRRQSSVSQEDSKRARLSQSKDVTQAGSPPTSTMMVTTERRFSKSVDERNRGKRLFGGLLGTLAQNSSSTAQKRRTNIERKQQEKLKLQAEKDDEKEKQKLQELSEMRRGEQEQYNKQSMLILQSNALAASHFLKTVAEPRIYYKPWELRPEDEAKIQSQVSDVKAGVKEESKVVEILGSSIAQSIKSPGPADRPNTVGQVANKREHIDQTAKPVANSDSIIKTDTKPLTAVQESLKECVDDGGDDVVEGEEDTVIY